MKMWGVSYLEFRLSKNALTCKGNILPHLCAHSWFCCKACETQGPFTHVIENQGCFRDVSIEKNILAASVSHFLKKYPFLKNL